MSPGRPDAARKTSVAAFASPTERLRVWSDRDVDDDRRRRAGERDGDLHRRIVDDIDVADRRATRAGAGDRREEAFRVPSAVHNLVTYLFLTQSCLLHSVWCRRISSYGETNAHVLIAGFGGCIARVYGSGDTGELGAREVSPGERVVEVQGDRCILRHKIGHDTFAPDAEPFGEVLATERISPVSCDPSRGLRYERAVNGGRVREGEGFVGEVDDLDEA